MDRIDRIFRLHELLANRRTPLSLDRIADALDCSERTAYRVIGFLRDRLGAPIEHVEERGYLYDQRGDKPYELPGLWFSADELQALTILYRHIEQLEPGVLSDQVAPLRNRLERLMDDRRLGTADLANRVRFVAIGQRPAAPERFDAVAEATLQRWRLRIDYRARSTEAVTRRTVDPQRLVHYRDCWYLDAWCYMRAGLRVFSVDRIEGCRAYNEGAADVAEHDLDRYYASGYGIFAGDAVDTAVLRFTQRGARWAAAAQWHPDQHDQWLGDGRYELRLPFAADPELVSDVLAYGPEVEVVGPPALRQRVIDACAAALRQYGSD